MKRICKKCNSSRFFEVPLFSEKEKEELFLLRETSTIEALKELKTNYDIELIDAKFIVLHINSKYGECNRCDFDALDGEYMNCPKCDALNFNWNASKKNTPSV